jgi:ribonucleoside-diphosphate reductase alpha chain
VSATVSVKEGEWEMLKEWMWDFKDYYNGISVLPYDGHVYIQAPFEEIDEQKFNEMSSVLRNIDLSNVVEYDDSTNLIDQAACAGGSCEIL